jgi:hypothetical protein
MDGAMGEGEGLMGMEGEEDDSVVSPLAPLGMAARVCALPPSAAPCPAVRLLLQCLLQAGCGCG